MIENIIIFLIVFIVYPVFRIIPDFKTLGLLEKVLLTIIASLGVVLSCLIFTGIFLNIFRLTSYALLFLGAVGFIMIMKDIISIRKKIVVFFFSHIREIKFFDSIFIITLFFFLVKFTYYLSLAAIIDWDVISYYLPLARTMYIQDRIPVLTGFNYASVRGGSFGISVIYAFVYVISGNILSENFRFLPLLYYLVTISLIYVIARDIHSTNLGKLAVLIYLFLPITDEMLVSYSYYPDIPFLMLFLGCFWLIQNFNSTQNPMFLIVAGLAAGSAMTIKPYGIVIVALFAVLFFHSLMRKLISRNGIIYEGIRISPLLAGYVVVLIGLSIGSNIIITFISIVLIICLLHFIDSNTIRINLHNQKKLVIGFCFAISCLSLFIIMTFGRNFFLFGSILDVSSMHNENIQWAIALIARAIESFSVPAQPISLAIAFGWLVVIFTTPALGTAWLFPKVLGLGGLLKKKELLLFIFSSSYFLMWFLFMGTVTASTTARWLYPLAPIVVFSIAYSIFKSTKSLQESMIFIYIFSFFSLIQSRMLDVFPIPFYFGITEFFKNLGFPYQVLNNLKTSPTSEQIFGSLYLGFIASVPFIIYYLLRLRTPHFRLQIPHFLWKVKSYLRFRRELSFLMLVFFTFSLVLLPTIWVTYEYSKGNPFNFGKYSRLSADYGGLYSEILPYIQTHTNFNETIIGIDVDNTGIQYYLPNVRIVDIVSAENLAIFRSLIGKDVKDSFLFLEEQNMSYFLFSKSIITQSMLNELSKDIPLFMYTSNPSYFKVLMETQSWKLLKPSSLQNLAVISYCNSTYGWSIVWGGNGSLAVNTYTSELGRASLTLSATIPETKYLTLQYNVPEYWNLTQKNFLTFFFKCDTADLNYRVRIYDYESNWIDQYFRYSKANEWQTVSLIFDKASVSSEHIIDKSKIDKILIILFGEPNVNVTFCVSDIIAGP